MRRRIIRASLAAAAAGATITTLGAAGAASAAVTGRTQPSATRPVIASFSYAGYEASGRDFRYVHALITVPDQTSQPGPNGETVYPQEYVQLSNGSLASGDEETRVGVEPCVVAQALDPGLDCTNRDWVGFIEAFNNSITGPYYTHFVPLDVQQGDGVEVSAYYTAGLASADELHFVITPPTPESCSTGPNNECYFKTQAYGPIFDHAAGLMDYSTINGTPTPTPIQEEHFRISQFLEGALTTYNGTRGSWTGPWITSLVEATSNGLPFPQGHVRVSPSFLWSDGLAANGTVRGNDAFGLWARISG
jgi:hypothetical protein